MAKTEHTQTKVFEEVDKYLDEHDNLLNYDCISKLPYLDACIDETLRLYPSLPNLTREVMEDYTFPTGLTVEKGVRIHLAVGHIQRNATYFPEPEKYRPERFLPEEKRKMTPYTYLSFGEGFRICIGQRFAKMQMMAGLVTVFKSYKVQLAEGQPSTLVFDPRVVINRPRNDVYLKLISRENDRSYKKL
ncbi:unnamed protein product [Arctia plantaginis]|uniref:unspecific monooxygenase n=1 Tax=Arctia plantaginis TaxID=874455 RepID=A0A8S1B7U4_ARCPL|nr:unnamed protein product [Arctia plantaginis]